MFWLAPIILACALVQQARSFGVHIPSGGTGQCFFREVHTSSQVSIHFVAREAINVDIRDPHGQVFYNKRGVLRGEHTFNARDDGGYQICVSADLAHHLSTTAKFRFLVFDRSIIMGQIADVKQVNGAQKVCDDIMGTAEKVLYAAHTYADTANQTDESLESSIDLAKRLVALECVAALVLALSQITYVRSMLSASRSRLHGLV